MGSEALAANYKVSEPGGSYRSVPEEILDGGDDTVVDVDAGVSTGQGRRR